MELGSGIKYIPEGQLFPNERFLLLEKRILFQEDLGLVDVHQKVKKWLLFFFINGQSKGTR
jgi:hypothetical protein